MTVHILEDGSRTDNRFGSVRFVVPPRSDGPPQHLHLIHDETFLMIKGTARFSTANAHIDAKAGDMVTVPPRAIHTFSNPFDEPAEIVCNFTPAYYVEYLRLIAMATKAEKGVTREAVVGAMANYATIQVKPTGNA
ncbi:RmlC-like cupin [Auricularia subglabra TFB-10046 SS5]|nr:RmlC-like cupin [Auricularia subglabra TFB-10046 SS5]